jgi:hypothetical protein
LSCGFSYDVHHESFYDASTALPSMHAVSLRTTAPPAQAVLAALASSYWSKIGVGHVRNNKIPGYYCISMLRL